MRSSGLRWLTVSLPVLFVIALELLEDLVLEPYLGRWPALVISFGFVALGATALSLFVFRAFERVESRLRRQNRDLAAVNETSRIVGGSLKLDEILARALESVLDVSESESGEIFLWDQESERLVWRIHRGLFQEAFTETSTFRLGEGIPGLVVEAGSEIVINDLQGDPRFKRQAVIALGFRAFASVPLRAKGRVVGVLNIADRAKAYTDADIHLLTAIGNQVGLALENARLYTQVEETLGYLGAVIESSGDAIITTDLGGRIKSWNPGAEHIYGWTEAEAVGQYLPMVPPHLHEETVQLLERLRGGETIRNFEAERRHKSGALISVVVTASPVRDASGNLVGLAGISKDISASKRMQAELSRQRQSLAVLEERERIAREMHDGLAQVLGYVNIKAQAVRRFLQTGSVVEAQVQLVQMEEAARGVYADVREAILGLRTPVSDGKNLQQALEEYLQNFEEQWGIATRLQVRDRTLLDEFSLPVEVQLIRIIQEALTNVRKHAEAQNVCVEFDRVSHHARVTIEDDGRGFDPVQSEPQDWPRFGLRTMQERAEGVEGALTVHSTTGGGTRICVTLPLNTRRIVQEMP